MSHKRVARRTHLCDLTHPHHSNLHDYFKEQDLFAQRVPANEKEIVSKRERENEQTRKRVRAKEKESAIPATDIHTTAIRTQMCYILQHTATHCNTLQHTANTATHCNTLQHTATHSARRCATYCRTTHHRHAPSHPVSLYYFLPRNCKVPLQFTHRHSMYTRIQGGEDS